jgi:ketoreductase RED2
MMDIDIAGKVALVTGSSSGIGAAVATALTQSGARVAINSARSADAGQQLADQLPDAAYFQADISIEEEAIGLVDRVVAHFGQLDIVVNNAGTTIEIPHSDLEAVTSQVWHRILDVNVIGTWNVCRQAIPHLRTSGAGSIINITSLAGVRPTGSSIPYAASKAALNHLTLLLANVVGPDVRVNAIAPGLIDTPWTEHWESIRAAVTSRAPLGRVGTADDIAATCLLVLGSPYMTGQILVVDGGLSLR